MTQPTHPLRLPSFQRLFIGRSVSSLSDALVPVALSLAILRVTGNDVGALSVVLACALGTRMALLPIAGVFADRVNLRLMAVTADLIRVATQGFVAYELMSGHAVIWRIALAQAVFGAASAMSVATWSPVIAGVVEGPLRQKANALMGVAKSVSFLLGPGLAGLLIYSIGPGWVFAVDATAFAVSAALMLTVTVNRVPAERRSMVRDLVEGWAEVRARDWYWSSLITHAVWNFVANVLLTLGPLVAISHYGGEGAWVAVLQAGGVGLLLGSLLAGWARPRRPVLAGNLALATYAIPLGLFAAQAPLPFLVAGYGIALAALGFLNPVWDTTVQAVVPEQVLARVSSYDWLVSLAAQPLGVMIAPVVAAAWGNSQSFTVAAFLVAAICLGSAAVPGVRNLKIEKLEKADATAAA